MVFGGSLIGTAIVLAIVIWALRRRIRVFSRNVFGNPNLFDALSEIDTASEMQPRSLNGCDQLLLPKILADFPDFDVTLAKTYIKTYLRKHWGQQQDFAIHKVVISNYLRSAAQKAIIFQAAVSWKENGAILQKRFHLNYTYLLPNGPEVAANCPNCAGALGFGQQTCPYCGSRVANALGNSWKVTEMVES